MPSKGSSNERSPALVNNHFKAGYSLFLFAYKALLDAFSLYPKFYIFCKEDRLLRIFVENEVQDFFAKIAMHI